MREALNWRAARPSDVDGLLRLVRSAYRGTGGWTSEVGLIDGERIDAGELAAEIASPESVVMVVPGDDGDSDGDGDGGGGGEGQLTAGERSLHACAVVRPGAEGIAHFGLFAVDPRRQARGTGRALLAAARRLAHDGFGAHTLEITVVSGQSALAAWYERLGFRPTGATLPFPDDPSDRPLVPGLHFVVMRAPTRRPPYALSWSGGRDSVLALAALTADGDPPPAALLTTVEAGAQRVAVHGVRLELLRRQAEALGVRLVEMPLARGASDEEYERAFAAACDSPPLDQVAEIAFGDLHLRDIRCFREGLCARLGREARFPLWALDTPALARRFIARGYRARVVVLDPTRIPAALAGHEYDERLLEALPEGVDPCGENGEFHTFVLDGPGFRAPVACRPGSVTERAGFLHVDLLPG